MNTNSTLLLTLMQNEVRLRLRRLSTLFALLAVVIVSWSIIVDPANGQTMIAIKNQRVLYTSSAMAIGSACMCAMMFGLGGFYLVRGRISEDIRSGIGSVIGATPAGNAWLLSARWLGGVAYLSVLALALMGTTMVCQLVRGDGPIQFWVYAQTFALVMTPTIFWAVSCAILFDSVGFLMGKGGDVLYFVLWMGQLIAIIETTLKGTLVVPAMLFDYSGMVASITTLQVYFGISNISVGGSEFNASLAPLLLPDALWTARMGWLRIGAAALALLPLLPAVVLFHRYSPDRVKVSRARERRSPLTILNNLLRPLARLAQPLYGLSSRLPGMAGQALADVALTLTTSPFAVLALLFVLPASLLADQAGLAGILTVTVAVWGVLVSDISTRDHGAATADMTGVVRGGIARRFLRQYAASVVLGLLFMAPIALRLAAAHPVLALAVVAGILGLSAFASMLGATSTTSRTFLALFLFAFYIAVNVTKVPMIDAFGFNGVATVGSSAALLAAGLLALVVGYAWNRRHA